MEPWHTWVIQVVAIATLGMPFAQAQTGRYVANGRLKGTITDQTGAAVPGAEVAVKSGAKIYSATTTKHGTYEMEVPASRYDFTVKKEGFCYKRAPLRVTPSASLTINAALPACAIAYVTDIEGSGVPLEGEKPTPNPAIREYDELVPAYKEESIPVSCEVANGLEMLITYGSIERESDFATYKSAVVTYDRWTIYSKRVQFDKRTMHLHAEGDVVLEDGASSSESYDIRLALDRNCDLVRAD